MDKDIKNKIALVRYFWEQGYQVIPYRPGYKDPRFRNWENWRTNDPSRLDSAIKQGWGFGILPNTDDFCFIDVDNDHSDDENGSEELKQILPDFDTVSATKIGGTNQHLFFAVPSGIHHWNFTGSQAIATGVELANCRHPVRLFPGYCFDNIDLSKSFREQLEELPSNLSDILDAMSPVENTRVYHNVSNSKKQCVAYLKKVTPPSKGNRNSLYRYLTYHLVCDFNLDYQTVKDELTVWDNQHAQYQVEDPIGFETATRDPRN